MMTNQRAALDTAVREGMEYGTPGERAVIALLGALLDTVTPQEVEPEQEPEDTKPAPFQLPTYEEIARQMNVWQAHQEPKVQERLRIVEGFGVDYDLLPSDLKSQYGSRFIYMINRAREVDEKAWKLPAEPVEEEVSPGRKVVHVNVPEQEQADMPDAVWVPDYDLDPNQKIMASDSSNTPDGYFFLMQVAMLTPEQRAHYGQKGDQ